MDSYDEPGRWDGWLARPLDPVLQTYLTDVGGVPPLSPVEEGRLRERAAGGDWEAGGRLVEANLRLVVHLARDYADRVPDVVDLVQAGNMGLVRAVQARGELASDAPLRDLLEREIRTAMEQFARDESD